MACYGEVHEENSGKIIYFRQRDLDKRLTLIDQPYTGARLLRMLAGHHAFHPGQLLSVTLPVTNEQPIKDKHPKFL